MPVCVVGGICRNSIVQIPHSHARKSLVRAHQDHQGSCSALWKPLCQFRTVPQRLQVHLIRLPDADDVAYYVCQGNKVEDDAHLREIIGNPSEMVHLGAADVRSPLSSRDKGEQGYDLCFERTGVSKPNGMLDSEINNQLRNPRLCFLLNIHIGEMSPG